MKRFLTIISTALLMLFVMPKSQTEAVFQSYKLGNGVERSATISIHCGESSGTGTVLGPTTIVTASHVVGRSNRCTMRDFPGTLTIIQNDPSNDFAVLRSERQFDTYYRTDCGGLVSGQTYYTGGYPFDRGFRVDTLTATDPYYVVQGPNGIIRLRSLHGQTNQGMSGGPVVDRNGTVFGILSAYLKRDPSIILVKELSETAVCRAR